MALAELLPNATTVNNMTLTGAATAHEALDDPAGAPDDDTTYGRLSSAGADTIACILSAENMPGPSVITSVAVKWRHRVEAAVNHTTHAILRINGVDYIGTGVVSNSTTYIDSSQTYFVNPATGQPWSRAEVDALQFGVRQDNEGTTFHRYTAARLTVDYQAASVANSAARDIASRRLWFYRKPIPKLSLTVPLYKALDLTPGDKVRVQHFAGPEGLGVGWKPDKVWQGRLMVVDSIDITPGDPHGTVVLFDLESYLCLMHDRMWTKRTFGDFADGVSRFNRGAATRTFARASDSTIIEAASGLFIRPFFNIERFESTGERFEPYAENHVYISTFHSGDLTGWTKNGTGVNGSAIAADSTDTGLWDPNPLSIGGSSVTQSAKFTAGTTHTTDLYVSQSVDGGGSYAANTKMWFQFFHRTNSGEALNWALQRGVDSRWWRDSDSTWQVALTWNAMTGTGGGVLQHISKRVDVGASSTTLTLRVGLPSGGTSGRISHCFYAGNDTALHITTPIITGLARGVRQADILSISNNNTARTLNMAQGAFAFECRPGWNSADLGNDFPTWADCTFDANNKWSIFYNGPNGTFDFLWKAGGVSDGPSRVQAVTIGTLFRVAVRWTGAQLEHGLALRTLDIWVNGVKGTTDIGTNAMGETASATLTLGIAGGSVGGGVMRQCHSYQWCPPDAVMERLPND